VAQVHHQHGEDHHAARRVVVDELRGDELRGAGEDDGRHRLRHGGREAGGERQQPVDHAERGDAE
jgi:hypothetical protein